MLITNENDKFGISLLPHPPLATTHTSANNNCYFRLHPNNFTNLLPFPSLHFIRYYTNPSRVKDRRFPFTNFVNPHLTVFFFLSDACQLFFLVYIT